ncbi:hypothetical protein NA57DRAFT_73510 [Rhizodiscina lignyota]|uniref:Uncharacterized protein n=1 Tax=Rhizodiscina lignyota TaxID=1504668 RepID=A0A9P4M8W2_9PEZI|nr:hypothetical protein NA57DRAFT_73510 [Rhizodiscina lignyota]
MASSLSTTPMATPPSTTAGSRSRAHSLASLRGPPPPATPANTRVPSVAGERVSPPLPIASFDLHEVNNNLERPREGLLVGHPTFVPSNTPAGTVGGTPKSHYGPTTHGLSQILEDIEPLPPSHASSYMSGGAPSVTSDPMEQFAVAHDGEIPIGLPLTPLERFGLFKRGKERDNTLSPRPEGVVFEHKAWEEEVDLDFDQTLARLGQLASDLHQKNPSKPAEEYYNEHLVKALNQPGRPFAFKGNKARPGMDRAASMHVEVGSPPSKEGGISAYQFRMLEHTVDHYKVKLDKMQKEQEMMIKMIEDLRLHMSINEGNTQAENLSSGA